MSVSYYGLLDGEVSAIEVTRLIQRHYGGSNFNLQLNDNLDHPTWKGSYYLSFDERFTEAEKSLCWHQRPKKASRQLSINCEGSCACDYEALTKEPMTYLSIGANKEGELIIDSIVSAHGGYVRNEAGMDEWMRVGPQPAQSAQPSEARNRYEPSMF